MLIPSMFLGREIPPDPDKNKLETFQESNAYKMKQRFTKTLYYGEIPEDEDELEEDDCPSLPLTDIAVEYFQDVTPRKLGRVNQIMASSIASRACVSPCSVMMSMIYAKRLRHRNPDYLNSMSSSDLFLISMMMASKFLYDEGVEEEVFNDEWAEAGDIELSEINQLEMNYLQAIDWQLFVKREEFFNLVNQIEQRIAIKQALDRGWFSYTDLNVLLRNPYFSHLWTDIGASWFQVVFVGSTAYLAGIMTLIGSTILALQCTTALTLVGTFLMSQTPASPALSDLFVPIPNISQPDDNGTQPEWMDVTANSSEFRVAAHVQQETQSQSKQTDILDTLLRKVFTLVNMKENLVQFISAVSENYHSMSFGSLSQVKGSTNNQSTSRYVCTSAKSNSLSSHTYENTRPVQVCQNCLRNNHKSKSMSQEYSDRHNLLTDYPRTNQKSAFSGHKKSCDYSFDRRWPSCCEEPPGFVDPMIDISLSFTTRSHLPISVGA